MKIENEYIKIDYCEREGCAHTKREYLRLKELCRKMENENTILTLGIAMQEQKFLWAQEQIEKTGLHKTNDALRVVVEAK